MQFYLDGILEIEVDFGGDVQYLTVGNLYIGIEYNNNQCWNGLIDEVSLWDYNLLDIEVQNLYLQNASGNEQGLVGYYKFDTGEADILIDSSGNNNHGVIFGASWYER
jgi:hypothetical protein